MSAVESPCIGVCAINPSLSRCIGCHRSLDEIGNWLSYTPAQRHAIMRDLEARRAAFERDYLNDDT